MIKVRPDKITIKKGGKQMKRLILGMIIALMLAIMPVVSQADEATQPITYGLFSANGATYFIPDNKVVVIGGGLEVARFYDLISLQAAVGTAMVKESDVRDTYIGPGFGINIPKLITMLGGQWIADKFNPSFNIAFLGDVEEMIDKGEFDFNYAPGLNFINYQFSTP